MSEQQTVNSDPSPVIGDEQGGVEDSRDERENGHQGQKLVPVSEAIRYRKRAQAAEKELSELKELHEKQNEELAALNNSMERRRHDKTDEAGDPIPAPALRAAGSKMTQGVKESRTGGARTLLQTAARQAADSGRRADVQEYLRLRRNFV